MQPQAVSWLACPVLHVLLKDGMSPSETPPIHSQKMAKLEWRHISFASTSEYKN